MIIRRKLSSMALAAILVFSASVVANMSGVSPAQAANPSCASGTDYSSSTASGYTTLTFSNTSTCDISLPAGVTAIDYLTVGGGGGGGGGGLWYSRCANYTDEKPGGGGGGGAGGQLKHAETYSVASEATLSITVGAGGASGAQGDCTALTSGNGSTGGTGGSSSIYIASTLVSTSAGGGGGTGGSSVGVAGSGGSNADFSGGTNPSSVTCNDFATEACFTAPGGAGAGAVGASIAASAAISTNGGNGGTGVVWSVTSTRYGGGGGGSVRHPFTAPSSARGAGSGGSGGGGNGNLGHGYSGTDGLGGGGGGGRGNGSSAVNVGNAGYGGAGGRGVVIVRYLVPTSTTLYVVADDKTVYYGDNPPTYTYKMHSGSAGGSIVSDPAGLSGLVCTSSYTSSTAVSTSPLSITCSGGAADGYVFQYTPGTLTISAASQIITFTVSGPRADRLKFAASSSSGLSVSVVSLTPYGCSVVGQSVKLKQARPCVLQATQNGNANIAAATPVTRTIQMSARSFGPAIVKKPQSTPIFLKKISTIRYFE